MSAFSLPTQRCFRVWNDAADTGWLFSAYAEVFPEGQFVALIDFAFLCLRRGVSESRRHFYRPSSFSLPTQRCFCDRREPAVRRELFSAYAEVFLSAALGLSTDEAFLCLRRGVSTLERI